MIFIKKLKHFLDNCFHYLVNVKASLLLRGFFSGAKLFHSYTKAGTYYVVLKVSDNEGCRCSESIANVKVKVKITYR